MIAVLDYGVGNLGSIVNMFSKLGTHAETVSDPARLADAERVVLPGVGSFDACVAAFRDSGLLEPVKESVFERQRPLLGICVGMQMLGRGSEEGTAPGLDWVPGECVRFRPSPDQPLKVPHMGWKDVWAAADNPLLPIAEPQRFYFLHSYHFVPDDEADVVARARYGSEFVCAVRRHNVFGVQFHPEKSHRFGMRLLERFSLI